MLAQLLARLLNFLRSVGHTKPIAAHCFCAVAFQGGVAASAFIRRRFSTGVSESSVSASALLHRPACIGRLCINSQLLPDAAALSSMQGTPASSIFPMALRHGAPASNKPHPAEKSTPVWLAIWRTWAGFANSQHRDAAFATPDNICAYSSLLQH